MKMESQAIKSTQHGTVMINSVKYNVTKFLGSGLTSKVYLGTPITLKEDAQTLVAIKDVNKDFWEHFQDEVNALYFLKHPNIIRMMGYKDCDEEDGRRMVYLEFCESDVFDVVKAQSGFTENVCRYFFTKQLLPAMSYMHAQNICHRDLKLDNLLITKDNQIKIADFSFATFCKNQQGGLKQLKKRCGTMPYMAPEIQQGIKPYRGDKADIFSLGVILFMMHMCQNPFSTTNFYFWLWRNPDKFWKQFVKKPSKQFKSLVGQMLFCDAEQRPSIEQIMAHPWIHKQQMLSNGDSNQESKKQDC